MASWYELAGISAQEFSADGIRTFAIVEGKGFPVLLLHGTPGASFIWDPLIRAVGRERLIIAPDLPGWGRSVSKFEKPMKLTRASLLSWFQSVLSAQGVDRFDLIAHGDAGYLAAEILANDPARVRRFGLMAPLYPPSFIGGKQNLLSQIWRRSVWNPAELRNWVKSSAGLNETGEKFLPLFEELFRQSDTYPPPKFAVREFAARKEHIENAVAEYGGAKIVIDEHGYFPMQNRPAEVAAEIAEFLRD